MIQVISATTHHHSTNEIARWFGDAVEVIPLSNSRREDMTRDYILKITAEIHEGVRKLQPVDKVYFLVTGNPYFNLIAYDQLRKTLKQPFIIMVFGANGYEVFASHFVSELLAQGI